MSRADKRINLALFMAGNWKVIGEEEREKGGFLKGL